LIIQATMSLRLQAFLLLALSAASTLAQVTTPVTIPAGVGLAGLSCQGVSGIFLSGTAVVAPNDEIKVRADGKVVRERTINGTTDVREITTDFLTGSSNTSNGASPGTCIVVMADPCEVPGLLEKTLTPVLLPTSQLTIIDSEAGVTFQVQLPNMYMDVKFGFNAQDANFAVTDGNEATRQADQCPGVAPQPVCADPGCLTGIPTGTCTTEYAINQKLSDCNFALDDDGDDPVYSGVLWVYAKVQLNGSFLGENAFQEVVSPIRWSVSLSRQITVSTNLVTLINENECEEDSECINGFCNKGVGLAVRECGDFKVAICRPAPGAEGPSEGAPTYTSMCIPRLDAMLGGTTDDIIPPFTGIAGNYDGSNYSGENIALHTNQCVESRPEDAINFCDCDAVGYEKDADDKTCKKDIEEPELSCSDVYAVWSDFGSAESNTMVKSISQLHDQLNSNIGSSLLVAENPLFTDNGYHDLSVTWAMQQHTGLSPFPAPALSGDLTSSHTGPSGYEDQLTLLIDPFSAQIEVVVNDNASTSDADAPFKTKTCIIDVYVFDDEDPSITCPTITPAVNPAQGPFGSGTIDAPLQLGTWGEALDLTANASDRRAGALNPTLKVFDSDGQEVTGTPDGAGGKTYKLTYTACDGADVYNEGIFAGKLNEDNCSSCDIYVWLNTDEPTCTGHSATYYVTSDSSTYSLTSSDVGDHVPSFSADINYASLQPYTPELISSSIGSTNVGDLLVMNLDYVVQGGTANADGSLTYGSWKLTNKLGVVSENACDLKINVKDRWSPTATCSGELVEQIIDMSPGMPYLTVADAQLILEQAEQSAEIADNENPKRSSISCENESATSNWLQGENTITCRATDAAQNPDNTESANTGASSCTYTVYVADNEKPTFTETCPVVQTNALSLGQVSWPAHCDATINLPDHTSELALADNNSSFASDYLEISRAGVTDNVGNGVSGPTVLFSEKFQFTYSGKDLASLKGLGLTEDHNVIDEVNQCVIEMQYKDDTAPQLSTGSVCPPSTEKICMIEGSNKAMYAAKSLNACDNVGVTIQGEDITDLSLLAAPTTVNFLANDAANNAVGPLCSWVSTPIDCEAPTIGCSTVVGASDRQDGSSGCSPGDALCSYVVFTDGDNKFNSPLTMSQGMGSDNVGYLVTHSGSTGLTTATNVDPEVISDIDLDGPALKPGLYTLSFTATDDALESTTQLYPVDDSSITGPFSATCQVELIVKDTTAPTLNCAKINTDIGGTYVARYNADNDVRATAPFPISWLPSPGDQPADGLAADNSGKIKSVTLKYRKKDSDAPFELVTEALELNPTDPLKDTEYEFELTVTDYADLVSDVCEFTATASDVDDPEYDNCSTPAVLQEYKTSEMGPTVAYLDRKYWAGDWNTAGAPTDNVEIASQTATDNGAAITGNHNLHEFFAETGVHTLALDVTDTSQRTGSCELKVKVIDDEKPKLHNEDGGVYSQCTDVFASGTVAVNATNAGGYGNDYTGPWFGAGHTAASPVLLASAPLWADNVSAQPDIFVTYSDSFTQIPGSTGQASGVYVTYWGASLALGLHTITITAEDGAEVPNSATCVIKINVVDKEAPSIDCGDDHTRHTDFGEPAYSGESADTLCTMEHPDCGTHLSLATLYDQVTANDNAGAVTAIADSGNPTFPLAASATPYEFRYYVDDGAYGSNPPNSNACIIKVRVNDNEFPVITKCSIATDSTDIAGVGPNDLEADNPNMQYVAAAEVEKTWPLALDVPEASDNVNYEVKSTTVTSSGPGGTTHALGQQLAYGTYDINVTIKDPPDDEHALSANCDHTFKVVDVYDPVVDCSAVYDQFGTEVSDDGHRIVYDDTGKNHWTAPDDINLASAASDNHQLSSTTLKVVRGGVTPISKEQRYSQVPRILLVARDNCTM